MHDEESGLAKASGSATRRIPRRSMFVESRPRHGKAIFRVPHVGVSLRLLFLGGLLVPVAYLFWWLGLTFWGHDPSDSAIALLIALFASALAALLLGRSLRSAFTWETLSWNPAIRCLRWIRETPFSARTDLLSRDEMLDVRVLRKGHTDAEGRQDYRADVSIRRSTGETWLQVAHHCDSESAQRLAEKLIRLTGGRLEIHEERRA